MADIKEDKNTTKWYTLSEAVAIPGVPMRTIQRRADKGEYKSKKGGRNRLVQPGIDDVKHDSISANDYLMSYFKQRVNQLEVELDRARWTKVGKSLL